ncbi:MAG TPA: potassium-transporting ATPase subunit KdpC [Bryobacteraceae bacterium]
MGPRLSHAAEPSFRNQLRPAIGGVFVLTLLTGVIFPLLLFAITRALFPYQARGSLVAWGGVTAGSELIGQDFTAPKYFHPRPSAAGAGYDGTASGGTNLAPDNRKLIEGDRSFAGIRQLAEEYRKSNNLAADAPIPIDAVTRSGSGLDPDISPENAALQVTRVARARGLSVDTVRQIVTDRTRQPQFGILGNPRVSVLDLNLALDRLASARSSP